MCLVMLDVTLGVYGSVAAQAVTELKWAQMSVLCVSIRSWADQRNRGATALSAHSLCPPPSTHHPPLFPPSPSSPPHQHIPTHWHCNCQDRFSQWGTWSVSWPASRWPYAPTLWFSHCCTMTHRDYCRGWALVEGGGGGGTCFRPSGAFMLTENI